MHPHKHPPANKNIAPKVSKRSPQGRRIAAAANTNANFFLGSGRRLHCCNGLLAQVGHPAMMVCVFVDAAVPLLLTSASSCCNISHHFIVSYGFKFVREYRQGS